MYTDLCLHMQSKCLEPHTQSDERSYFQKRVFALSASDLLEFFALSSDFNLKIKTTQKHTHKVRCGEPILLL